MDEETAAAVNGAVQSAIGAISGGVGTAQSGVDSLQAHADQVSGLSEQVGQVQAAQMQSVHRVMQQVLCLSFRMD